MKLALFLLVILSSIILSSIILLAEPTGKISGKITDIVTGEKLESVNVLLADGKSGAATNMDGIYLIKNLSPGKYKLKVAYIGYESKIIEDVEVFADSITNVNIQLLPTPISMEEIIVSDSKFLVEKSISSSKSVSADKINYLPRSGVNNSALESGSREYTLIHNTEEYDKIEENTFFDVLKSPLSTFAVDVDVASYANARRFIMQDKLPIKDAIRTEEFINYFSYNYKQPENGRPLSINLEYSDCPWNKKNKLIHIGLQGKTLSKEEQKPSNLVFLIDVSGSMNQPQKLPLLKKSFKLLVDELNENDKIAIVVYASRTELVLHSTFGSEKDEILEALNNLSAGGSTAGGSGIQLAYKVASENFIEDGNNRIILATDGDFNVGVSSNSELVRIIEEERKKGIYLTVLGFGMGNYKDSKLQQLADKGNGNHAYIDNILEAKKVLVNDITSTLYTIAKDVKIQVEFNPAKIKSYRLIGYENRKLDDKDFEDDKKDAGEIGAGHSVTALYEVQLVDSLYMKDKYELKYLESKINDRAKNSNEVLTVKIRYKAPDGEESIEFSDVLSGNPVKLSESSNNLKFSSAVTEFAMLLNDSDFKGDADISSVLDLAKSAKGEDAFGYRAEFISLVERVKILLDD